ncbi:MAG: hypothetical protein ABIF09_15645 [Gemmatimonadota bacterium]
MKDRASQRNPFEYGRELGRDELVDRQEELARIAAVIRNRGRLFLIGPRRFGKTSLLSVAGEGAEENGVIVLRFDAEKYETLGVLSQAILTAGVRALRTPMEKASALINSVAASLRPRITLGPDGSLTIALGVDAETHGEVPLLTDALDAIDDLASRIETEVVVILDEIQQIVLEHGETAERQLRATIQRHRHVGYIFAGSATRLLTTMTEDAGRPFYRLGERMFLGEVPKGEFLSFLVSAFQSSGFHVDPGGCEAIMEMAEEVPYNVQRLAHEAWEMLRAGTLGVLNPDGVADALRRIVKREDPAYTQIWSVLTKNQKKALKAILESGGRKLQSGEVSRRSGISASSIQAALKALEERHLIRQDARHGDVRHRLVDPFLGAWLEEAQKHGP